MDGTKICIFVPFLCRSVLGHRQEKEQGIMKNLSQTQKLTISALCMALYLVVMLCTQSFAFGQYQVRIATALYGLSAIFPFLVIPFGLVNVIANTLMGGLGPLDMLGGGLVGIVTSLTIVYAKRHHTGNWAVMLAITLIPGLGASHMAGAAAGFALLAAGFNSFSWPADFRCRWHGFGNGIRTLRDI